VDKFADLREACELFRGPGVELAASKVCCDTRGLDVALLGLSPPEMYFDIMPECAAKPELERKAAGRITSVDRVRARAFPDRAMALSMTSPAAGIIDGRLRQITAQVVEKGCMHVALKVEVVVPRSTEQSGANPFGCWRP
jgi:hypothetical protein